MNSISQKVYDWINANFYISDVKLEEVPVLPGGFLLTDKNNNKMLIWLDINTNQIKYEFQKK